MSRQILSKPILRKTFCSVFFFVSESTECSVVNAETVALRCSVKKDFPESFLSETPENSCSCKRKPTIHKVLEF